MSVNPFSCLVKNVEASRSSLCQAHVHWRPIKMTVFTYLFFLRNEEGEVEEQSSLGRTKSLELKSLSWNPCGCLRLLGGKRFFPSPFFHLSNSLHCLLPLSSSCMWTHEGEEWLVSLPLVRSWLEILISLLQQKWTGFEKKNKRPKGLVDWSVLYKEYLAQYFPIN